MNKHQKIIRKRKSFDDDQLDDSFDFFLPNKLKEKRIIKKNSNPLKKLNIQQRITKKFSSGSSSVSSVETIDSDMENVLTICQSKVNFCPSVDSVRDKKKWKEFNNKLNRQPLLKTRTNDEREALLSQKLAIILVDSNELGNGSTVDSFTKISTTNILVNSNYLVNLLSKDCRLWLIARTPLKSKKEFYIPTIYKYLDINLDLLSIENKISESENSEDSLAGPNDEDGWQQHSSGDKSCADIFNDESVVKEVNVDNLENSIGNPLTIPESPPTIETTSNKDIIELISTCSTSPSVSTSTTAAILCQPSSRQQSISSSLDNLNLVEKNNDDTMLDRIGVILLADQWNNLFNSNNGDVNVLLGDTGRPDTLNVHRLVVTVRCPKILNEITIDSKLLWFDYNLQTAKAFFRYIYTGKCDHLWYISSPDLRAIKQLSSIYNLTHLEQVLFKFHSTESINIKSDLNDFKMNSMEICENSIHSPLSHESLDIIEGCTKKLHLPELNDINKIDISDDSSTNDSPIKSGLKFCTVKKSLEAYFQDSFPELPSFNENYISSPQSNENNLSIINNKMSTSSRSTVSSPTISTVTPSNLHTPSGSSVLFTKDATPYPNYDQMITPELKRELNKYGLKGSLGTTKAKLLLKYIYEQTHPLLSPRSRNNCTSF